MDPPVAALITDFSDAAPDPSHSGQFRYGSSGGVTGGTATYASGTLGTLTLAGGAPGTVSLGRDGFPVVACGIGGLKLLKLQRAGKSAQSADAFLRGFALAAGSVLAPPAVVPLPT